MLFASQAATAIANARSHRNEQRARAGLEALVETSAGRRGDVRRRDRHAGAAQPRGAAHRRGAAHAGAPGRGSARRAHPAPRRRHGRVTLDQLKTAKTLRATEVELSVPDGRSIRMLVNVMPIQPGDGPVESVVVTMQDLARLEELERMRAEFLSMVSQELRTPLTSIKGSTATLLGDLPGLGPRGDAPVHPHHRQAGRPHAGAHRGPARRGAHPRGGRFAVDPEPAEVAALVDQARSRFLSGGTRQAIRIELPRRPAPGDGRRAAHRAGAERPVLECRAVLLGVVARSCRCGARTASRSRRDLSLRRGPGPFRPSNWPTCSAATPTHGAGSPKRLPATVWASSLCKGLVEAHGGRIRAESAGPGLGARVTFTLPVAEEASRRRPIR